MQRRPGVQGVTAVPAFRQLCHAFPAFLTTGDMPLEFAPLASGQGSDDIGGVPYCIAVAGIPRRTQLR